MVNHKNAMQTHSQFHMHNISTIDMNDSVLASLASEEVNYAEYNEVSSIFAIGMAIGYVLYGVAIIFGIPCNGFVLYRMYKFARCCSDMFNNGTGVCLFAMAIADILSLMSILVHYVLSLNMIEFSPDVHIYICKLIIFMTHVSTSVSIWSWLLMSMLRYLSVYYPLVYIRLWKLPRRVLSITFGGAFTTNLWLLYVVSYSPPSFTEGNYDAGGCNQLPMFAEIPELNRVFLFVEIFWSFCIPTATIIFVDSSVYMCRYSLIKRTRELERDLRKNTCPHMKKNRRTLWRWLVIALIDVGLNTPENINRLTVILGLVNDADGRETESYLLMRVFSQLLYYLQFSFNGVYLALFIFDKSTRLSSRSSRNTAEMRTHQDNEHVTLCGKISDARNMHNSYASNNAINGSGGVLINNVAVNGVKAKMFHAHDANTQTKTYVAKNYSSHRGRV
uniref:G_PROTEIN_RECEP_F1_2 domain-containing protein n=1 Tax=Panagrellus redivivus TaxID=6233 RepID=A0A7E4V6P2_PANRE